MQDFCIFFIRFGVSIVSVKFNIQIDVTISKKKFKFMSWNQLIEQKQHDA